MKIKVINFITIIIVITVITVIAFPSLIKLFPSIKLTETPSIQGIQFPTKISATIGEHFLTLSGWTSPQALVFLSSSGGNLSAQTLADQTGFFIFKFVFLPNQIGELSLIAQDSNGLVSSPLYLPEPPSNQDLFIENILLSPTLSLSKSELNPNETVIAFGKTFPNSKILVYQYSDPKTTLWKRIKEFIIKPAFAKTIPILEVESNNQGNFEFNLPSSQPAEQKIFVASLFGPDYSPKSFTLSFKTLSFWEQVAAILIFLLSKVYLWFETIAEDPTKIIWLEIPLLAFLFIRVLLREWVKKISADSHLR